MRIALAMTMALALTFGIAAPATAAASTLPPLDPALLRQAIAGLPNDAITGAQVTVSGSAGAWAGRNGVADLKTGASVPFDGRYRIASITKVFTADLVLQLAAEHRLGLDQTVQRLLPGELPADYPPITVRQLLEHTAGLPSSLVDQGNDDPEWFVAHRFDYWTPEQVVASAVAQPIAYAPGTEQRYNGTGYFLAGMIIEKISGHSYAEELSRRILRPLGLHDTSLPAPGDVRITGPHAHGYLTVGGTLVDITEQSPWGWAESGIISTNADLTRLFTALFRHPFPEMFALPDVPYTGGGNCGLGPNPGRACYSVGLEATRFPDGVTAWGKSGQLPGYSSAVFGTGDRGRLAVYDLNPTGDRDGTELPYIQNLAAACFDPALFDPSGVS
jgi:D-alanyl-D-alanine carboxypeptidase